MPTATLLDYLAADTIEAKNPDLNEYLLDGTLYTVPDDVLKAGGDVRQAEDRASLHDTALRDRNLVTDEDSAVDALFDDDVDTRLAKRLLQKTPETFYITGTYGIKWHYDPVRYGSDAIASDHASLLITAEQRAAADYPKLQEKYFPNGYSQNFVGHGLYVEDSVDESLYQDYIDELEPLYGLLGLRKRADGLTFGEQFTEIRVASKDVGSGVRIAKGGADGTGSPSRFIRFTAYGDVTLSEVQSVATKLQTFLEDALAALKANHFDNWDQYWGYETVPVVTV